MKKIKNLILCVVLWGVFIPLNAQAQSRRAPPTQRSFTYDLGASSGSYSGTTYSEIDFGLNWLMSKYWVWRNAVFTRFGSGIDSAFGLDSSLRFAYNINASEDFGIGVFAGPGVRLSDQSNSGIFGEAGLMLKVLGLSAGIGVKSLTYNSPGNNANGAEKAKTDTTIFIIVAGGGGF